MRLHCLLRNHFPLHEVPLSTRLPSILVSDTFPVQTVVENFISMLLSDKLQVPSPTDCGSGALLFGKFMVAVKVPSALNSIVVDQTGSSLPHNHWDWPTQVPAIISAVRLGCDWQAERTEPTKTIKTKRLFDIFFIAKPFHIGAVILSNQEWLEDKVDG